jgi:hypothetical protein
MPHATGEKTLLLCKYLKNKLEQKAVILASIMSDRRLSAKVLRREYHRRKNNNIKTYIK